jgi:general secretion pathway protein H
MILINYHHLKKGLTIIEMSIVIFLMSLLLGVIFSLVQNFSIFKTTQGEAEILKDMYTFAKRTAVKSGQIIYMDFDLDNNKYIIYKKERNSELNDKVLVERKLFLTNRIIYIKTHSGNRIDSGKITIHFYPQDLNDEVYLFLGSENNVKKTIVYPRYGNFAMIKTGESFEEESNEAILKEDKGENF